MAMIALGKWVLKHKRIRFVCSVNVNCENVIVIARDIKVRTVWLLTELLRKIQISIAKMHGEMTLQYKWECIRIIMQLYLQLLVMLWNWFGCTSEFAVWTVRGWTVKLMTLTLNTDFFGWKKYFSMDIECAIVLWVVLLLMAKGIHLWNGGGEEVRAVAAVSGVDALAVNAVAVRILCTE